MKTNIATTPEQSQRLLACGVPADTADMAIKNTHRYGSRPTPIIQFDENGNFIARHNGIREAERATGITHGFITRCCKGKALKAQGFIFLYEHDAESITDRISQRSDAQPPLNSR